MKKKAVFSFLTAILAFGLTGPLLKGAMRTGSLGGEVTDPSGAAVPGAKILVTGNHWSKTFSTDQTGQYVITGLAPGTYEVSVSSEGFAPSERAGLVVSAGYRTEMDSTLDLAVLKQVITVTAEDSLVSSVAR